MPFNLNININEDFWKKAINSMLLSFRKFQRMAVFGDGCMSDYDLEEHPNERDAVWCSQLRNNKKEIMINIIERVYKKIALNHPLTKSTLKEYIKNVEPICLGADMFNPLKLEVEDGERWADEDITDIIDIQKVANAYYYDNGKYWCEVSSIKICVKEYLEAMRNMGYFGAGYGSPFYFKFYKVCFGSFCEIFEPIEQPPLHKIYDIYSVRNGSFNYDYYFEAITDYYCDILWAWFLNDCYNREVENYSGQDDYTPSLLAKETHKTINDAVAVIQRAWKKCRWTMEYKICRDICNRTIDEEGWNMK